MTLKRCLDFSKITFGAGDSYVDDDFPSADAHTHSRSHFRCHSDYSTTHRYTAVAVVVVASGIGSVLPVRPCYYCVQVQRALPAWMA